MDYRRVVERRDARDPDRLGNHRLEAVAEYHGACITDNQDCFECISLTHLHESGRLSQVFLEQEGVEGVESRLTGGRPRCQAHRPTSPCLLPNQWLQRQPGHRTPATFCSCCQCCLVVLPSATPVRGMWRKLMRGRETKQEPVY